MENVIEKADYTFKLTEEQELLKKTISEVSEENFKEKARDIDKTHRFPRENYELLAKLGMAGLILPEAYGGAGLDYVTYAIVIEEIAKRCATTAVILSAHLSLCSIPIALFGILGAICGSFVANYLSSETLRKVFGVFLLIVGCIEIKKGFCNHKKEKCGK